MSLVLTFNQIVDYHRGKTKTIRKQQCKRCWTVLAIQCTDNVENTFDGDFYTVAGGMTVKGEFQPHYIRSGRWFGNHIKCPKCGIEGNLPGDKPLNWEQMKQTREAVRG